MKDINRRQFITVAGRAIPITIGVPYLVACSSTPESMVGPNDQNDLNAPNNASDVIVSISSVDAGHTHGFTFNA